jgi:hypothetical protein
VLLPESDIADNAIKAAKAAKQATTFAATSPPEPMARATATTASKVSAMASLLGARDFPSGLLLAARALPFSFFGGCPRRGPRGAGMAHGGNCQNVMDVKNLN